MDSKNLIITNKGNFFDLMNMTMQLCATMEDRAKKQQKCNLTPELQFLALTAEEISTVESLIKLIRLEVNFYASVGLSNERDYWGVLQAQMRKVLPE
jgi:hypothetical protein